MLRSYYGSVGEIVLIPIKQIQSDPFSKNSRYHAEAMEELEASIAENGLLEPITVRAEEDHMFRIIAGERRFQACVNLNMTDIPCILLSGDESTCAVYSLIDNQQHLRLHYLEEAELIRKLLWNYAIPICSLADKIGKTVGYINEKLKLLELPREVRDALINYDLQEEYARIMVKESEEDQKAFIGQIVANDFSLTEAKKYIEEEHRKKSRKNKILILKDIKVFTNTIDRAIETMEQSGVDIRTEINETNDYMHYSIKISK